MLQFGAELYGHAGLEADLEIMDLALQCLGVAGLGNVVIDLADARIVRAVDVTSKKAAVQSAVSSRGALAVQTLKRFNVYAR